MTLLAGLAALLHRYTGQTDILVAAPTAGRSSAKTRALIGDFINTLVLRTDLSGEPTFRELIARGRRTALDAYSHQELPINKLVSALNPERDASGASLVRVMLVLQNNPLPALAMPGLTTKILDICTGRALYDLAIELWERAGRLVGWLDYDRDLFEAGTIARITGHFRTLLEAAAKEPVGRSASCRCCPPRRGGRSSRPGTRPTSSTLSIPVSIATSRRKSNGLPRPSRWCSKNRALSYRELNGRANRLAHRCVAGGRSGDSRRGLPGALGRDGGGPAGACSRPGGPMCRWTRSTRRSDWRSWWQTAEAPLLLTQRRHRGSTARIGER